MSYDQELTPYRTIVSSLLRSSLKAKASTKFHCIGKMTTLFYIKMDLG
jgi:hypothetical protein